ncbi:hypothetical protein [Oscillatoria acuminata]|uniref:AAA+ ATPase domain-containing protein n=1 Tax=Oscillatoria acuminata PCC 6304 TaxID=56110 RepID=K9TE88_9CYAN|nr:hypothetical protein [Oscillatoria acuminata]AFY81192.1 hypothetical protein Oscil6304_1487 [Oscillatoria acuminata PCC 6304]
MSNRLERFRKEMAAFEGAADPARSVERGHYVPHPKKSLADTIAGRIAIRPSSTHLLIGGIGSGKTTELLIARDRINELEDTYAHYLDVSLEADISQMKPGVLIAIAGVAISELVSETDHENLTTSINIIRKLAYGYKQTIFQNLVNQEYQNPLVTVIDHPGMIPVRPETPLEIKGLQEAINTIKQGVAEKYGTIVLLVDGLDRLYEDELFVELIADVEALSEIGIGVVLVGPIQAAYSKHRSRLENTVNSFSYQPCFDVAKDPDARDFFAKILAVRASEGFLDQSSVDRLILYSGGMLRDLMNLTQSAIEEAYLSGSDNLQPAHVDVAAQSFGRAKVFGISDEAQDTMQRVSTEGKFIPRTEEDIRLLVEGKILEYRYPQMRHAVHPAILPLIKKSKKV